MKKKLLIAVLLLAITFLGVRTTKVLAENGPSDEFSYASFYDLEAEDSSTTKAIYEPNQVHNDALEGATYDKSTNTLTLNNLKTNLALALNEMGEDFKINLVGENEIAYIICYGFGYGGNIEFVGNGSLVINKDKSLDRGVVMAAEGTAGKFVVGSDVTLKVYGKEHAVKVFYSNVQDGGKVIVLKNGQDISKNVVSEQQVEIETQSMRIISFQDGGNSEYNVATKNGKNYAVYGEGPYHVYKQTIASVGDYNFFDPWSNPNYESDEDYETLEKLEAAGYTLTSNTVNINSYPTNFGNFPLAVDNNGTRYVFMHLFDQNNQESYVVYSIGQNKVTLADGYEYTLATLNENVQFESLTELLSENPIEGIYSHTVNLKELEVIGASNVPEVVTASDNKSDNDKAAAKAVNVLLDAAKNGEEVIGMSAELISAINEAVENGDDVTVELDTTKMELKDVSDEVKAKVEAKIKEEKSLKDSNVLGYFDINLIVKINGDALDEKVTDLKEEMEVKLDVSELVKNLPVVASGKVRQYNVITIHNGEVKVLKGTLNADNTLSFKTNGFSSYVVTYNDVDADTVNPKTLDNVGSYVAILVVSMIGFMITALCLKKRNN